MRGARDGAPTGKVHGRFRHGVRTKEARSAPYARPTRFYALFESYSSPALAEGGRKTAAARRAGRRFTNDSVRLSIIVHLAQAPPAPAPAGVANAGSGDADVTDSAC